MARILILFVLILILAQALAEQNDEDIQFVNDARKLNKFIKTSEKRYVQLIRTIQSATSWSNILPSENEVFSESRGFFQADNRIDEPIILADNFTTVIPTTDEPTMSTTRRPTTRKPPKFPISKFCTNQSNALRLGLTATETWAIQMYDAAGKPSSNILGGGVNWLGDFDECLGVGDVETNITGIREQFRAQYCKVRLPLRGLSDNPLLMSITINTAVCVPNSCSKKDVQNSVRKALFDLNLDVKATTQLCIETTDNPFDARGVIALIIVCCFLALMCLGTAYDIVYMQWPRWQFDNLEASVEEIGFEASEKEPLLDAKKPQFQQHQPGTGGRLLLSFSVYTNGAKILDTKQSKGVITCINGIRFLSMTWVILGHTYSAPLQVADNSADALPQALERWTFMAVCNAFVSVDSFFTLSGLLLTYLIMKELKKNQGKLNWGLFYFHRFWRLTPPYMLVLMVYVCLFQYVGSGPNWRKDGPEYNHCEKAWYFNLLYINNFAEERENKCFGWAWYLANDMQFFVLSPLILLPLFFFHLAGLGVILAFLIGTWITTGIISTHYDIPASNFDGGPTKDWGKIYTKPYCRMGPYLIGMYTGYLLYRCNCRMKINRYVNLLIWALAAGIGLVVVYGLYDDINGDKLSTEVTAFYNAVHRSAWGLALSWVIFACATGNGGYVNTILSWKGFVPLSKLTYMTYLVHLVFINYWKATLRKPVHLTTLEYVYEFLGHTVLSYMAAFVTSLAFESPMLGLESVLLKRKPNKR